MTIGVVIVDDEPLARRRIRSLLARELDVTVLAECPDGAAAVDAIRKHRPELLFLDVQMPEMDGFEVLRRVDAAHLGAVVLVTAYEDFALKAFDIRALDYLLKPFHRTRFQETLRRVRARLGDARELGLSRAKLAALLGDSEVGGSLQHVTIRSGRKTTVVRTAEIDWIEADGNYARLHVGRQSHLLRQTMKALAEQLDPQVFLRIHHSRIINVRRVRSILPWSHGDYIVVLEDGRRLTSSRSYSSSLRRAFAI